MKGISIFLLILGAVSGLNYVPHTKEHFLTDLLLRDMVDRMSKDLAAAADNYLEMPENSRLQSSNVLSNRVIKDLENEETSDPVDFERLSNNPNPSLRDQEYLQHSSLWGHQFVAGGAGEGKQRLKPDGSIQNHQQIKTDSALPAYCNPPNPCPIGYTAEDGCLEEFENTAAFSRDYQSSQDCMCDSEHMFECPVRDFQSHGNELNSELDLDRLMERLSVEDQHKNLVAKKFHIKKDSNPFLQGEKLPVAAKKALNKCPYYRREDQEFSALKRIFYMSPLLSLLFLTIGILLAGNGVLYGSLFSDFQNRDDYFEDYYLRKIPKLKTSPEKVKKFFVNHLGWFPVNELEKARYNPYRKFHQARSYFVDLQLDTATELTHSTPKQNLTQKIKENYKKVKNFTKTHPVANWTNVKEKSCKSVHKVRNYMKKKHLKEVFKNATHPLRYRGPSKHFSNHSKNASRGCYKYMGPSIRIHPKSSHVEVIRTSSTTSLPVIDNNFPITRKVKVIIDLKSPERISKIERNINSKNYAYEEDDNTNNTNVLETAGEMASDLAGRVTSLWHSVLGSHRIPNTKDVKFYLYTRRNIIIPELMKVNYDLISRKVRSSPNHADIKCVDLQPENIGEFVRVSDKNREIIKSNFLNIKAPTKILIHGYTGSYKDSRMAKIKDAYLQNGRYNVIQVDWEMLAAPPCYIRVTQHSKFVGETIAKFLDGLYLVGLNMSLVHLVGFSLGAQVAGFAGNSTTVVPVCRITGLDPALPLFLHTEPSGHLDRLDAKFVDVIHTCGGILAMLDPLGHVDFYPNGGTKQPGCEFSNLKCSHSRAPQYFAESVVSQKKFTGHLCLNWEEYVTGNCKNNTETSFMGEPCNRRSRHGKYYLLTKSKEPFVI